MKRITDVLGTIDPQHIDGMTLTDYLALPHMSGSVVKSKSLKAAKYAYESEVEYVTDPMRLGSAIDSSLFDHLVGADDMLAALARFDAEWPIYEGKTRRGKEWQAFSEMHGDSYFRNEEERDNTLSAAVAVSTDKLAAPYWQAGVSQAVLLTSEYGVLLKHRPDWITDEYIVDLKSTADVSRCHATTRYFGYLTKMALYRRALRRVTGAERKCVLIFVEQKPPFDVVVMPLDAAILDKYEDDALETIKRIAKCTASDHWPGWANGEEVQYLPTWGEMEEDEPQWAGAEEVEYGEVY